MDGEEILTDVVMLLTANVAWAGQEPYRGDLFKLCRHAFEGGHTKQGARPLLTADQMTLTIRERWPQVDERALDRLTIVWGAWLYAMQRLLGE